MKKYASLIILLLTGSAGSNAQSNEVFSSFARTKDSLMHIDFYDKNITAYKKQLAEMKTGYDKLNEKNKAEFKDQISEEYYYLARAYAAAGDKSNALANLELSKYSNYNDLLEETDLNSIRKEPGFIAYMNKAKSERSKHMVTLRKDAKYNEAEQNHLPAFTYQSASDPNLTALKTTYGLDTVAGDGDDISRMMNLMKWVHYLIPHDGSKGNPPVKNAMSLIAECTKDRKTLNCRGLAIVLNEVFLAEGFKSRYITCMPKDTADNDCHVITMVWSTSLKKWLWMDPTFMTYIMNEEGSLLSIEEVRDRLVKDKMLILNPDANRNHGFSQEKSWYLDYYMAKNLYKMECPVNSTYNYETQNGDHPQVYIQLRPGTSALNPVTQEGKQGINGHTLYYTNNPKEFWAAPTDNDASKKYTKIDYEAAIDKFENYYNNPKQDEMNNIFYNGPANMFTPQEIEELSKEYGKMASFKFIGMEIDNKYDDIALFKVTCDKSTHCMAISLDKNGKLATTRFKTYSNYIDWVLAKSIDNDKRTN